MIGVLLALGLACLVVAAVAAVARGVDVRVPILTSAGRWGTTALLGVVCTVAALLLGPRGTAGPASARTPGASLHLTPATVTVGGRYRVTGDGFAAGERVRITWMDRGTTGTGMTLGETVANAAGAITPLVVTEAATPAHYSIRAHGTRSGRDAAADLLVTAR